MEAALSSGSGLRSRVVVVLHAPIPVTRWAPWIALFLPLFVYNIGFRFQGGGDSTPAQLLPISLFHGHGFDFREFVSGDLPYWFRLVRGRVVSNYPVLPGLLNVPTYAAARLAHVDLLAKGMFLSALTASAIAALSVLFLYLALTHVCRSKGEALLLSLVYAFGTTVWSVASRAMMQHAPSVLFLSIALWALLRGGGTVAWAGLALGLAVINRPTNAVLAVPLAVYVLRYERRRVLAFSLLALVPGIFQVWYAGAYWGSPFSVAQDVSPANFAGHMWSGLAGLLVSPSRGLFVSSSFFLFAIPAAVTVWRPSPAGPKRLARYLIVGVLLMLLLYSRWVMWWGGHSFGYRLLTELTPPLTVLLAVGYPRIAGSRLASVLFALAVASSVYIHFLGAGIAPSGFNDDIDLQPKRLWAIRNSEIELSTRKLIRALAPRLGIAARYTSGEGISPPAPAWWRPDLDDDSIPGWIDGPLGGETIRGSLEVSGWAQSAQGDVDVRVAIAPDGLVPPVERRPRPDVQHARPELGDCSRAGWRVVVARPAGAATEHVLLVELKTLSGKVRRLGPIRFRWKG